MVLLPVGNAGVVGKVSISAFIQINFAEVDPPLNGSAEDTPSHIYRAGDEVVRKGMSWFHR